MHSEKPNLLGNPMTDGFFLAFSDLFHIIVMSYDQIKNLVLQRDTRENIMAMQTIDLKKLDLMQLTQIKNQLDQDLQFYQESLGNLKHAQTKFQDSGDSLGKLTPENKDKEILVPLTGSMYVPGQLSNSEKVLVDIGTGM